MKEKFPILHFWTDRADAERLIHALAATGTDFEARFVKTHAEYASALATAKFALIIADGRAETAGAGSEDLSLYQIAEEISPGTPFVLLCDPTDPARRTGEKTTNLSFVSRQNLRQLSSVINRFFNRDQN